MKAITPLIVGACLAITGSALASDSETVITTLTEDMAADQPSQDEEVKIYYKDGLRLEYKEFKFRIGGRIQYDVAFIDGDDYSDAGGPSTDDYIEFRRSRIFVEGQLAPGTKYKSQIDFAGVGSDVADMWIQQDFGAVDAKIGRFKEPAGLEQLTSSKYITFMERSSPTEAFTPSRNTGVQTSDSFSEGNGTWAVGVFQPSPNGDAPDIEGGWNLTGRVTYAPVNKNEGKDVMHVGLSYSLREGDALFLARPEIHFTGAISRSVNTGIIPADDSSVIGVEAAWVNGPFSMQGEFYSAMVDATGMSDVDFSGSYVQASWFASGEHRNYSKGAFGRVVPNTSFSPDGEGFGAWEWALRYSTIDLNDGAITGGEQDNITVGANWHLNRNTRIGCNYVFTDLDSIDEDAQALMIRFQVDF